MLPNKISEFLVLSFEYGYESAWYSISLFCDDGAMDVYVPIYVHYIFQQT